MISSESVLHRVIWLGCFLRKLQSGGQHLLVLAFGWSGFRHKNPPYFLLSWDNEGIGPPPLANLKPQSPYSGEHLRVSDIFLERVVLYILVEPALHFVAC